MLHENAKDIICWLNAICSECEWHVVTYILDDSLLSNRLTNGGQRANFFVHTSNPPESMVNVCVCGLNTIFAFSFEIHFFFFSGTMCQLIKNYAHSTVFAVIVIKEHAFQFGSKLLGVVIFSPSFSTMFELSIGSIACDGMCLCDVFQMKR